MKRIVLSVCAAVATAGATWGAGEKLSTRDYVQDGLIAIYDGFENSLVNGVRMHKSDATKWDELTGSGTSFVNPEGQQLLTFLKDRVALSGGVVTSLVSTLSTELGERTLEVVFRTTKCTSTDLSAIYVAKTTQGGIYYQCPNTVRLCAEFYESSDRTFHWHQGSSAWDGATLRTYSLVTDSSTGTLYSNGTSQSIPSGTGHDVAQTKILSLGTTKAGNAFEYCSIRLYNRKLTQADRTANHAVDVARFNNGQLYDASALQVQGDPLPYGGVSPAYGEYEGLLPGDRRTCSVVSSTGIGRTNVTCIGYAVYTNDVRTAGAEYMSGDGSSFEYVHPADACATIVWKWHAEEDTSLPLVEDVTVRAQGDALVVRGTLSELGGESCALKVYVREAGNETVNEWTSEDWTRTETGDFELTLCESDPTSPRAFKFGKTYFVTVEATASGGTSRSEEVVFAGATPRAALYEQNGMVINLDAIENAGPGVHLDDTSAWHDLKGNADMALGGTAGFTDRYVNFDGSGWAKGYSDVARDVLLSKNGTVEVTAMSTAVNQKDLTVYDISTTTGSKSRGLYVRAGSNSNLIYSFDYLNTSYCVAELKTPVETFQTLSATLGSTCYFSQNGTRLTTPTAKAGGLTSLGTNTVSFARVGFGSATSGLTKMRLYAFRMYDRRLSADEAAYNYKIDRMRFEGAAWEDAFGDGWRMSLDGETLQCRVRVVSPVVGVGTDGVNFSTGTNDFWVTRGETITIRTPSTGRRIVWSGAPSGTVYSDTGDRLTFTVKSPVELTVRDTFVPTHVWTGAAGTTAFATPGNWEDATGVAVETPPGHDSSVFVPVGAAKQPTASAPIDVAEFRIGRLADESGTATFTSQTNAIHRVAGCFTVYAGGVITHTALPGTANEAKDEIYRVAIDCGGAFTLDAGAEVNANAKGYASAKGPGHISGTTPSAAVSAHACTMTAGYCYGSVACPTNSGSGAGVKGGGAVYIRAVGVATVNGTISCDAAGTSTSPATQPPGAGGSVWLTAKDLCGSGKILARGSYPNSTGYKGSAGGGRIAVHMTEATSFANFDVDNNIKACGQSNWGGAGTIYLQAAGETRETATLIVDNNNVTADARFVELGARTDSSVIGNLIVRKKGHVQVIAGETVTICGNLTTASDSYYGGLSGTFAFAGTGVSTITGSAALPNVTCTTPGKVLRFGTGTSDNFTFMPSARLTLRGSEEDPVVLSGTTDAKWKMQLTTDCKADVKYVSVSNSNASAGLPVLAIASTDQGGNDNWGFSDDVQPGDPIMWTGAGGNSLWTDTKNWEDKDGGHRAPIGSDSVIIPKEGASPEFWPVLEDGTTVQHEISVAEGGSLTLKNCTLYATNVLKVAGRLVAEGATRVICSNAVDFAGGTFTPGTSTFRLEGPVDQSVNPGNCTFNLFQIEKNGGSVAFSDGFSAATLDVLARVETTLAFAPGRTVTVADVRCRGVTNGTETTSAILTLASSAQGERWLIAPTGPQLFSGVTVRDSQAVGGAAADALSADGGNNANWTFGRVYATWTGKVSTDFFTAANWYPAVVPGADSHVLIAPRLGESCTVALGSGAAFACASMRLGVGEGTVTFSSTRPINVAGDFELGGNATVTLNSKTVPNTVGGNFIMRKGATLAHTAGGDSYGVNLEVAGDITIEATAKVDANGKGYGSAKGPGYISGSGDSARSAHASTSSDGYCYGSIFCPANAGSGANTAGGGTVRLVAGGTLRLDGTVDAAASISGSSTTSGGTGGSVWLTAGVLEGNGTVDARGKNTNSSYGGNGGRIAVHQTEAKNFDAWDGELFASGGANNGGPGTVYKRTAATPADGGTVQVLNVRHNNNNNYHDRWCEFPVKGDDPKRTYRNATLDVGAYSRVKLTSDVVVNDLVLSSSTAKLELGGYTLTVRSRAHRDREGWAANATVTSNQVDGVWGKIVWKPQGMAIIVR